MVGLLLPALILKIRTYFIFEGFLSFLFMPIDIASLYLNKQSASKLFLNSILNTDVLEAFELLHTMWPICLAVFLVWGIYIYLCITIPNLPLFNSKLRYWGVLAIITTTMAIYGGQTLLIRKINPTFTVMTNIGVYENAGFKMIDDYKEFYKTAREIIDKIKVQTSFKETYNDSDLFDDYYKFLHHSNMHFQRKINYNLLGICSPFPHYTFPTLLFHF